MEGLKKVLYQYRHGAILSYFFIYLLWFTALEKAVTTEFTPVYMKLDDYIIFNELFVIPYFLWFFYIFITVAYFFFTSKPDYYKCCANLFIGMTICLIIYTLWPNGQELRVDLETLGRENALTRIVAHLYTIDTNTNVFPSIHVFNSIAAMIAIYKSEKLHNIKWLQVITFMLTVSISLSTVYLKQHSVADIFGAIALNIIMYVIIYVPAWGKEAKATKQALNASQTL